MMKNNQYLLKQYGSYKDIEVELDLSNQAAKHEKSGDRC